MTKQTQDILEQLSSTFKTHKVKVLTLLSIGLVGLAGLGGYKAYDDYMEDRPIDVSRLKFQKSDLDKLVSEDFKGGQVLGFELEREDNMVVYDVQVEHEGKYYDVEIDANTGQVLKSALDKEMSIIPSNTKQ